MFVAVALFAIVAGGLVFSVGTARLGVVLSKSEIIKTAGKKGVVLCAVSAVFPVLFIARIIDVSRYSMLAPYAVAAIIIAIVAALVYVFKKVK